jgi:hypothetical protein
MTRRIDDPPAVRIRERYGSAPRVRVPVLVRAPGGRAVGEFDLFTAAISTVPFKQQRSLPPNVRSRCSWTPGFEKGIWDVFQGLTLAEMRERFPQERAEFERGDPDVIPGGESARQRLERSAQVLTSIVERHSNQIVAVVTHGGFLMGFFEFVLGIQPGKGWRFKRHNASYNAFEYEGDRWSLHTWNDISHLDGLHSQ